MECISVNKPANKLIGKRGGVMYKSFFLYLFFSVFLFCPGAAHTQQQLVNIPLHGDINAGSRGVSKMSFVRRSTACFYSPEEDRIVEVKPNIPRQISIEGHPSGDGRGVLFENYAENTLLNSSFEMAKPDAHWAAEGLKTSDTAIHGSHSLEVTEKKALLRSTAAVPLTPIGAHYFTPTFTAYIYTPDGKSPAGRVRPAVWAAVETGPKEAEIFTSYFAHKKYAPYEFQKVGSGNWWRMLARILEKEYGLSYYFGLEFTGAEGIKVDALQMEKNSLPWTASSYIPTLDKPGIRQTDVLMVKGEKFDVSKGGSISLWIRVTNPGGRVGNLLQHPASSAAENRIFIYGQGVQIGKPAMKFQESIWEAPPVKKEYNGWRFAAATWDGEKAFLYLDGREFSKTKNPWKYSGLAEWTGEFLIGSNGGRSSNGAEGIVRDVILWDRPLTENEIRVIYEKGEVDKKTLTAAHLAEDKEKKKKMEGVPIKYSLEKSGSVTVGIYDSKNTLVRYLQTGVTAEKGEHTVYWDGLDNEGRPLPSGDFTYKGAVSKLKAEWITTVGNSGRPPWGDTKVRTGLWNSICRGPDGGIIGSSFTGEGNRMVQRYDREGNVIWTCGIPPVNQRHSVIAADEKYVYVVMFPASVSSPNGRPLTYELLWRLDIKTGHPAPWSDGSQLKQITESRSGHPELREFYYTSGQEMFISWELYDIEAKDGKIYMPLNKKKTIRIVNAGTLEKIKEIPLAQSPRCIAVRQDGDIYVSYRDSVEIVSARDGKNKPFAKGLDSAWDVEIDKQGNVYVSELGRSRRIKKFSSRGRLLQTFGGKWDNPYSYTNIDGRLDRFAFPVSLCVQDDGIVWVADLGHGRIARLDSNGRFLPEIETFGMGGMDGSPALLPTEEGLQVYSQVTTDYSGPIGILITRYDVDIKNREWKTIYRWLVPGPVLSREPMLARRLPNGRTYLFILGRYPAVFEVMDNKLVFCTALLHTQPFGRRQNPEVYASDIYGARHLGWPGMHAAKQVVTDLKTLNLLDPATGEPRCRMVWTDHNRDGRIQTGEVTVSPGYTGDEGVFYSYNDGDVDQGGNLFIFDYGRRFDKQTFWRFDLQGFDRAGNPVYDWNKGKKLWSMFDHIGEMPNEGKSCVIYGKKADNEGNVYVSTGVGAGCFPTHVNIQSYSENGRLRWKFGEKAKGYKSLPGEFNAVTGFAGIAGDLIYALDYAGFVDVVSTDGIYLTTLLESGNTGGEEGPYSNWGENFHGDAYMDSRTGEHYVMINTHNYALPLFRIDGVKEIKRFSGRLSLDEETASRTTAVTTDKGGGKVVRKTGSMYLVSPGIIKIDGNTSDWTGMEAMSADFGKEKEMHNASVKAAVDKNTLYILAEVADPDPAVNNADNLGTLWTGDCLELYLSPEVKVIHPVKKNSRTWSAKDRIVHFAAREGKNNPVGIWFIAAPSFFAGEGVQSITKIWDNKKGYTIETSIPLKALEFASPSAGETWLWDWDVIYAGSSGGLLKLQWTPDITGAHFQTRDSWDFIKITGLETISAAPVFGVKRLQKIPNFSEIGVLWKGMEPTVIRVDKSSDTHMCRAFAVTDGISLFFRFEINDPFPALNTATSEGGWWGTGDGVDIFLEINGQDEHLYIPGATWAKETYRISGGRALKIEGSTTKSVVNPDGKSYLLEAKIPVKAAGGVEALRKGVPFNFRVSWSDATGGSIFAKVFWLGEDDSRRGLLQLK
jgi:hypothetical protein